MLRVDSHDEAFDFFLSLRERGSRICRLDDGGREAFACSLPETGGGMIFAAQDAHGSGATAILYLLSERVNRRGVSEIRFVETVKKKR
jgi:hypothetical protein